MAADKAPAGRKQLLVVDDDRLVLSLMASGLTDAGYEVTTADSAEDAEAWLASGERPDLAILDVRMPGQGGLYLAQRLRELDHVPFMMLSAYSDAQIVEQATACGALGTPDTEVFTPERGRSMPTQPYESLRQSLNL